ncbi:MAG TPA: hypothetical protein VL463_27420 [Kofleriaceae bacterium]|jgi:hypothetical protein|nr:hypothetical protein [Kofleriaceae bacterium]
MKCPVCERPNTDYAPYCVSCGADLKDPDVLALAGAGPTVTAPGAEASLASDRFLGVSAAGLADGRHLSKLAWIGGALLVIAFLVPIDPDFGGLRMSWSLLGEGRTLALILPLLVGAAAIELAVLGNKIPQVARAAFLVAAGAAVFALAIDPLAPGAGAAPSSPWLCWAGALVAGVGVAVRVLRPLDRNARWVIAGGFALALIGLFIPFEDSSTHLPIEYALYIADEKLAHKSLWDANLVGLGHDFSVRFLSLWHLALPVAIAGAFALAWRRPQGPWDTKATGLRPLGAVIVLYVAISFVLYAFNLVGGNLPGEYVVMYGRGVDMDAFQRAIFAGRAHLALVTLGASAWIVGGGAALLLRYVPVTAEPTKSA